MSSQTQRSFQFKNFAVLFTAGMIILGLASFFVINSNFEEKITGAQHVFVESPQKTSGMDTSITTTFDTDVPIKDKASSLEIYDSEMIFSELESELLNHKQINSKELFAVIQKIDFNDQINEEKIHQKLQFLNSEQSLRTDILVNRLNQLIYNEQMFIGPDLNLNAVAIELLDEFDSQDIIIDLENLLSF